MKIYVLQVLLFWGCLLFAIIMSLHKIIIESAVTSVGSSHIARIGVGLPNEVVSIQAREAKAMKIGFRIGSNVNDRRNWSNRWA